MAELEPVVAPGEDFDSLYGAKMLELGDEVARAEVPVRDAIKQPWGLVHGGIYAALSESLTSVATLHAVLPDGFIAIGQSNATSFLRPIREGTVHATARRRYRGRTSWVWDVDITDDAGRLCAVTRMTIAVRPAPAALTGRDVDQPR